MPVRSPREIKSLSRDDLSELKQGGGWGLAKAAELNGVPGPSHLLELKDEIDLSPEQITAITRVFEDMRSNAIQQGEQLIALERELELQFRQQTITGGIPSFPAGPDRWRSDAAAVRSPGGSPRNEGNPGTRSGGRVQPIAWVFNGKYL